MCFRRNVHSIFLCAGSNTAGFQADVPVTLRVGRRGKVGHVSPFRDMKKMKDE